MDNNKKLEDKIDKIGDRLTNIDVTLAKQSVILEEHVKRTNLLEHRMEPVEKHVIMIHGAMKLIGFIALFFGIIEGLLKMVGL